MPRIKVDIPTFLGLLNIEDFLDWVSEIEKYFELMDIPEESQVKYVAYKLIGAASSWWVMTSNNVTFIASFIPLIMEYLVKISKKARILELKQRHLKITVLTSNTPYPSRKIRRICACTSQKTTKETRSIRRIQERPIRRIQAMEIIYSGRYQTWSLLQETLDTPY
ncbi:hypothetical protein Tco_0627676 [Tanacetum coccineum]|uniref:Retrotransposon gag domain-containing protein n=1 Tax=Tanacetum coccineum TaxID=301880 RepID=A0ABQ4WN45_9ASTR